MEYFELTKTEVERNSLLLSKQITDSWGEPDIVIFIAKGAYLIGHIIANQLNKPLLEIHASRKANKLKRFLSSFLALIPHEVKRGLRKMEIRSGLHNHISERNVYFDEDAWRLHQGANRILVVDDSIDTGLTIKAIKAAIKKFFPHAEIRIAALNCFSFCSADALPDFALWSDTLLNAPWSNDSKENKQFMMEYEAAKKSGVFV